MSVADGITIVVSHDSFSQQGMERVKIPLVGHELAEVSEKSRIRYTLYQKAYILIWLFKFNFKVEFKHILVEVLVVDFVTKYDKYVCFQMHANECLLWSSNIYKTN